MGHLFNRQAGRSVNAVGLGVPQGQRLADRESVAAQRDHRIHRSRLVGRVRHRATVDDEGQPPGQLEGQWAEDDAIGESLQSIKPMAAISTAREQNASMS